MFGFGVFQTLKVLRILRGRAAGTQGSADSCVHATMLILAIALTASGATEIAAARNIIDWDWVMIPLGTMMIVRGAFMLPGGAWYGVVQRRLVARSGVLLGPRARCN